MSGRRLLEEQSEPLTSRRTADRSWCWWENVSFQAKKTQFWEKLVFSAPHDGFLILSDF